MSLCTLGSLQGYISFLPWREISKRKTSRVIKDIHSPVTLTRASVPPLKTGRCQLANPAMWHGPVLSSGGQGLWEQPQELQ